MHWPFAQPCSGGHSATTFPWQSSTSWRSAEQDSGQPPVPPVAPVAPVPPMLVVVVGPAPPPPMVELAGEPPGPAAPEPALPPLEFVPKSCERLPQETRAGRTVKVDERRSRRWVGRSLMAQEARSSAPAARA